MLRSIGAMVAGYLTIVLVMFLALNTVLTEVDSNAPLSSLGLAVGFFAAIAGGLVAGGIGRPAPMIHALALAMVGIATASINLFLRPPADLGTEVASILIPTAGVLVGGWLAKRLLARRSMPRGVSP